jgi:hypothetical protein
MTRTLKILDGLARAIGYFVALIIIFSIGAGKH